MTKEQRQQVIVAYKQSGAVKKEEMEMIANRNLANKKEAEKIANKELEGKIHIIDEKDDAVAEVATRQRTAALNTGTIKFMDAQDERRQRLKAGPEASKIFAMIKKDDDGVKKAIAELQKYTSKGNDGGLILERFDRMARNLKGEEAREATLFRMQASNQIYGSQGFGSAGTKAFNDANIGGYQLALAEIKKREGERKNNDVSLD